MFFLERWGFLLETPPNKLFLFNHFLIVLSLTLIFNMLTDACKVWTVAVGQICTWGQLLGYSLLERLEAVLNVFPQWITFSHCRMIVWKQPYNPSLDGQQQLLMSFLLGSLSNQARLDSRAALLPLNSYKGVLRFPPLCFCILSNFMVSVNLYLPNSKIHPGLDDFLITS